MNNLKLNIAVCLLVVISAFVSVNRAQAGSPKEFVNCNDYMQFPDGRDDLEVLI